MYNLLHCASLFPNYITIPVYHSDVNLMMWVGTERLYPDVRVGGAVSSVRVRILARHRLVGGDVF